MPDFLQDGIIFVSPLSTITVTFSPLSLLLTPFWIGQFDGRDKDS
jgi:hypothetical protein